MIKRTLHVGLLVLTLFLFGSGDIHQSHACAGYTITVGSDGSPRQELITQIMAELIRQRTGTKIKLQRFDSQNELVTAAEQHHVDLLVVTGGRATRDAAAINEDKLKLLMPFGYQESQVRPAFHVATLKRFPALQRLVNRLAGIIDDETLRRLEKSIDEDGDLRVVAKKFLQEQKLIFGS